MILEVSGEKYKLSKRKAKVGEKILLNHDPLRISEAKTIYGLTVVDVLGKENYHNDYIVLEKIEDEQQNYTGEHQFKEMTNNGVERALNRLTKTENPKD